MRRELIERNIGRLSNERGKKIEGKRGVPITEEEQERKGKKRGARGSEQHSKL